MLNVTRTSKESWQAWNKDHSTSTNAVSLCESLCCTFAFVFESHDHSDVICDMSSSLTKCYSGRITWSVHSKCSDQTANVMVSTFESTAMQSKQTTLRVWQEWTTSTGWGWENQVLRLFFNMRKTLFKQVPDSCRRFKHLTHSKESDVWFLPIGTLLGLEPLKLRECTYRSP